MRTFLNRVFLSGENCIAATRHLLHSLQVKVSERSLVHTLEEHPDYPSMLSISDALAGWNIQTVAVRASKTMLPEMPLPFIAQLKENCKSSLATVTAVNDSAVTLLNPASNKQQQMPVADFEKKWTGVTLVAEKSDNSGDEAFSGNQKKQWLQAAGLALGAIVLLLLLFRIITISVEEAGASVVLPVILTVLKLAGLVTTSLLLLYELDKQNTLLQKICKSGKRVNCNAVLRSAGASLNGWVSWSEMGFVYFAGGSLMLLFSSQPLTTASITAWMSAAALPYIFYSVYYQWKVVKQWCVLCLTIQGILLLEFTLSLAGGLFTQTQFPAEELVTWAAAYLLPGSAWFIVKPYLLRMNEQKRYESEWKRMKFNAEIFRSVLHKQKTISATDGLGITLGNPAATNRIIKVCNPYCGPCAQAHPVIDQLLENNADVQIQIIFNTPDMEEDEDTMPARHLMALHEHTDPDMMKKALDDWYIPENKDYQLFAGKYPLNGELKKQGEKLAAMHDWCSRNAIAYTPTIFINGYQLPEMYRIEDIKYFV